MPEPKDPIQLIRDRIEKNRKLYLDNEKTLKQQKQQDQPTLRSSTGSDDITQRLSGRNLTDIDYEELGSDRFERQNNFKKLVELKNTKQPTQQKQPGIRIADTQVVSKDQTTPFKPDGDTYDYQTALMKGFSPDKSGHWQSIDPETGMLLKGINHPTINKTLEAEKNLGNVLVQDADLRYYSVPSKDFMRINEMNNRRIQTLRKEYDVASGETDLGTRTADMIDYLQSGALPGGQDVMKMVQGMSESEDPLYRKAATIGLGALGIGLKVVFPAIIPLELAGNIAGKITERHIEDPEVRKTVDIITHVGISATLGLPMLIGTLTSLGATTTANKIMEGTDLDEKDKALIEEATGHIFFFAGAGATKPLKKVGQKYYDKFYSKVYEQYRGYKPGDLFDKNRKLTPDGIQHFKDRLKDPGTAPAEKEFIRNMLKKNGVKLSGDEVFIEPLKRGLQIGDGKEPPKKVETKKPTETVISIETGMKQRGEQGNIKRDQPLGMRMLQESAPRKRGEDLPEELQRPRKLTGFKPKALIEEGKKPEKKPIITPPPKPEIPAREKLKKVEKEENVVEPEKKQQKPEKKITIKKVQITGTKKQKIQDTPLKDITIREEDFQGRDEPFSQDTFKKIVTGKLQLALNEGEISEIRVKKIIDGANKYLKENHPKASELSAEDLTPENTFDWNEFGQIGLWRDPKSQKLVVLSGHSRRAASEFLSKHFDEFAEVPTTISEGITFEEAKSKALKSNVLGTQEKITSHAERYRKMREKGTKPGDILKAAKTFHGRESQRIINLSHLNRSGRTIDALKAAPEDRIMLQAADWIGGMRRSFDQLTDSHEDEMFQWLISDNALGTKIKSRNQFLDAIDRRVSNITFNPDKPLNLKEATVKSRLLDDYEKDVVDKTKELEDEKSLLDKARSVWIGKGLSGEELDAKLKPGHDMVIRVQRELIELKSQRDRVIDQESRQVDMFGDSKQEYKKSAEKKLPFEESFYVEFNKTLDKNVDVPYLNNIDKDWFFRESTLRKIALHMVELGYDYRMNDVFITMENMLKRTNGRITQPDLIDAVKKAAGLVITREKETITLDAKKTFDDAINVYGTTEDPFLAGYMLPDGRMIDFSGGSGERQLDHREISSIGDPSINGSENDYSIDMVDFMKLGVIRMSMYRWKGVTSSRDRELFLDMETRPTKSQWMLLDKIIADKKIGTIVADINDGNRRFSDNYEVSDPETYEHFEKDVKKFYRGESIHRIGAAESPEAYEAIKKGSRRKKLAAKQKQINSDNFKSWFGKSKITEADSKTPLVVYHGTTRDIKHFDPLQSNVENHFGRMVYFTDSKSDVNKNYLELGMDLKSRIEAYAEKIESDIENYGEASEHFGRLNLSKKDSKLFKEYLETGNPLYKAPGLTKYIKEYASKKIKGSSPNVVPVYLKMENPLVIRGNKGMRKETGDKVKVGSGDPRFPETNFNIPDTVDMDALLERDLITMISEREGIDAEEVDLTKYNKSELDQYRFEYAVENNYYNEPEGGIYDVFNAIENVVAGNKQLGLDPVGAVEKFKENLGSLGIDFTPDEFIPAHKVDAALRSIDELYEGYGGDLETGGNLANQVISEIYKELGFDGVILTNAEIQFEGMHLDPNTNHFQVYEPTQVKSAIGNNGEFNPDAVDIIREDETNFKRSKKEGETKEEYDLQNLRDWRNHLKLTLKELEGKQGEMKVGQDRYGVYTITVGKRRAQINKEIDDVDKKIEKLREKIPQKVKLENQIDIFGMDVKAPQTNEQLLDDLLSQREKIMNAIDDDIFMVEYWQKEVKNPEIRKDKNLYDHAIRKLSEKTDDMTILQLELQELKKRIGDIDGNKPLDEAGLKDQLKEQHQELRIAVEQSRKDHANLLKKIEAAGLFADDALLKELETANKTHLDNVKKLETFLGENTNLYEKKDNPEDGNMFVREQIELSFETRKVLITTGNKNSYNKTKYVSWMHDISKMENPTLRKLQPGEEARVERKYKKYNQLKFFGKGSDKVGSVQDVVYMMKQLETEGIEHAFVVHVLKDGKSIIQHISTGSIDQTVVDPKASVDLANRLGTKEIYFVHNHPSGGLEASLGDINVLVKYREIFNRMLIKVNDGIIIDIRDGRFSTFSNSQVTKGDLLDLMAKKIDNIPLPAITFSRNVFREPLDPETPRPGGEGFKNRIKDPADIAVYLSKARYGLGVKNQLLVLTNKNEIAARVFIQADLSNVNIVMNEIQAYIQRFAGTSSILVSTGSKDSSFADVLRELKNSAKVKNVELLDIVLVEPSADPDMFKGISLGTGESFNVGEAKQTYSRITPADWRVREPGSGDPRADQNRPRLETYVQKIEESMPSKMEPERLKRLTELEAKEKLTPEERVELKNLRKEKKGFAALDPLIRRKLSTDIIKKIKNIKTGYRIGSAEREKQLADLRKDIMQYAKIFLPRGKFMKSEVSQLMNKVSKAKDLEGVQEAFNKINQVAERVRRRTLLAGFNKLIRESSPERGDPQFITWIKKIRDMKPEDVEAEMERVLNDTAARGIDMTEAQDEYFYLLQRYSDIKNKSTDELEELYLELAAAIEAGRSVRKAWLIAEKERRKMLRDNAVEIITGGQGVVPPEEARFKGLDKEVRTAKEILSNLGTMTHSWEMILDKLSKLDRGSEPFESWLNQKFAIGVHHARNAEGNGVRSSLELVRNKLFEIYGTTSKRKVISQLQGNSTRQNTGASVMKILERDEAGLPTRTEMVPLILSQNEAAYMLMVAEDPQLKNTFEKMGWGLGTLESLRNFVKPEVMRWAKWQLDEFYPSYYHGVDDVYKQIRGVKLPYNSKYMPIRRQHGSNVTDADFLGDVTEFVSIINGSLLARVNNTRPIQIRDLDRVLLEHIITMEHFKAFAPIMQDMRAVFNAEEVRRAIAQYHGGTMLKVINRFVNDFARGGVDRKNTIEILDKIRANFIRSVIGVNPVVTVKQLTAFPAFAMEIPVKDFMTGLVEFAANPIPKIKFLLRNSDHLKSRYHKGWERDIILAMNRARKTTAKELTRRFTFTDAAMMFTKFGDAASVMFGGWGVYRYWKKKYLSEGKTPDEAQKAAMLKFELSVKRAQQAGDVEDLGELQRQGSWQKLFTIFQTAPKQYFSNSSAAYRNILYKRGKLHQNIKRLAISHLFLPLFFQFISDGFRWDKDHMIRAALLGSLNGILILGDAMEFMLDSFFGNVYYEFDETPIGAMTNETKRAIESLSKTVNSNQIYFDEVLETADAVADAVSKPFGIPYQPASKWTKGIMDFTDAPDEENFLRLFGYPAHHFEDKPKLDPMIEEIKKDENRLKDLKEKGRENPKDKQLIDEAKEFEKQLNLKKSNSEDWKKYQEQKKLEQKEKRKNDPFIDPAVPKTKLGKFLKRP